MRLCCNFRKRFYCVRIIAVDAGLKDPATIGDMFEAHNHPI